MTPMKLLVVDDTKINQLMLEHLLTENGVEVVCVSSGREAIEVASQEDFALILLDVQMPVLDGYDTARELKLNPRSAQTPIIFITSIFKDDKYVQRGYEVGAADYIFRPVDSRVLRGKVSAFLELHRQKERLRREVERSRSAEEAMRRAETKYRAIFENAAEGIFLSSLEGTVLEANDALARILGYSSSSEFVNVPGLVLELMKEPEARDEYLRRLKRDGSITDWQYQVRRRDGEDIWLSESARLVDDLHDHESLIEGIVEDITARKESEMDLHRRAHHDSLTGIPNRHSFLVKLRHELKKASHDGDLLAVLFVDLNDFKKVNDAHGHGTGDEVLRKLAKRLTGRVRGTDYLGRLGGDEFGVILTGIGSMHNAENAARGLASALHPPFEVNGLTLNVGCTIGISLYPEHGREDSLLVSRADEAMYEAKKSGVPFRTFSLS